MHRISLMMMLFVLAAGCNKTGPAPVSGRITMDGEPLANAIVTFQPPGKDGRSGPSSEGKTDADGKYTLKVLSTGVDGAMIGSCKVSISATKGAEGKGSGSAAVPMNIVPIRYNAESTLTFDVPPGGSTTANFDLTSK